jgi:serine protease Do
MSIVDRLRTQRFLSFTLILFTLAVGIVLGTLINRGVGAAQSQPVAPGATPLQIPNPTQLASQFTQIARTVEPSVVNISTTYLPRQAQRRQTPGQQQQQRRQDDGMQDFFDRFFGSPFGGLPQSPEQRRGGGLGSGVVVDRAGYIITNNHVIDRADRIQVRFTGDPNEYDAKVVGVDPPTDIAVIRVTGKKEVVPAKIGNSDSVQVGDWVVAIGSPFGFQATVTQGIVSAKEREVPGEATQFQQFLQTDAAINPGNSGGPLLNIQGEVVGINTAIATRTGGYQGIGFALPMNAAVRVYNEIIKTGRVTRGGLGISFARSDLPGTRDLMRAYGASEGVFIESVAPGGPADKAGIKAGDIVVAIDNKPIRNGQELVERVTTTSIGSSLNITVLRDNRRQNFNVTVADLAKVFPDRFGSGAPEESTPPDAQSARFGMSIGNVTPADRSNLGIDRDGALVDEVTPGSFADDVGLRPRDLIIAINRQPVNNVDDVKRISAGLKPGDAVAFQIMRQAGQRGSWLTTFLAGTMPENR